MQVKANAIIALTPAADQSAYEGYFVELDGSGNAAVCNAATDIPLGVILDGEPTTGKTSIAVATGFCGTALVKCAATPGTIVKGSYLVLDGTTLGAVKLDPATGARTRVARALEAGAAGALIEAVLIDPIHSAS
jgi:hypothetical protein